MEPRSHLRCLLKMQTPRLHVPGFLPQWLWAGTSRVEAGVPQPTVLVLHYVWLQGAQAALAWLVEVNAVLSGGWDACSPNTAEPQGHLHTRGLLLLHQKPAGSMEAELTVGIWAVIKMGHHSCSHGRVCWGERKHVAQIQGTARHPTGPRPPGEGARMAGLSGPSQLLLLSSHELSNGQSRTCL